MKSLATQGDSFNRFLWLIASDLKEINNAFMWSKEQFQTWVPVEKKNWSLIASLEFFWILFDCLCFVCVWFFCLVLVFVYVLILFFCLWPEAICVFAFSVICYCAMMFYDPLPFGHWGSRSNFIVWHRCQVNISHSLGTFLCGPLIMLLNSSGNRNDN